MDSAKPRPGGRPPTPWNSSRKRKLVRLFMLTTLTQVEIEDVLKAEGFSPSWSDIQKKLRSLLPGDYRKEWRKYRPADTSNLRFKRLRGGRKDPNFDAQQKGTCLTSLENDSNTRTPQSYSHLESFEGPLSAFRSYSGQVTATQTTRDSITPSALISESQLVVPSRLLLDGSAVGGWWPTSNSEPNTVSTLVPKISTCRDPVIAEQRPGQVNSVSNVYSSSVISFHSLEQRISDRSSSIIRHVYSVLCYSMGSSSASNLSQRSSWWSRDRLENIANSPRAESLGTEAARHAQSRTNRESLPKRKFFLWKEREYDLYSQNQNGFLSLSQLSELSEGEQRIWNEMIDETRVAATSIREPYTYSRSYMSLRLRYCCEGSGVFKGTRSCPECLALPVHWLSGCPRALPRIELEWRHLVNERDVFDHTPLHFAAASQKRKAEITVSIIALIKTGANILAVNTRGETFLHTLLSFVPSNEVRDCFPLFRFLATINFPFCQRDHHGRTPLHVFLERCRSLKCGSFEVLEEMIDIMKPEIESMDNIGRTISYYLNTRSANMLIRSRAAEMLSKHRTWQNHDIDFHAKLTEAVGSWQIWKDWVATAGRPTWVDLNGDTALIALIKHWSLENDELLLVDLVKYLVEIGTQIHACDRSGDTSLVIASMHGFRLVVKVLLDLQASVHSCNYCGATVLNQARKSLSQARESGNDRLYAKILSCIVLLVDCSAHEVEDPMGLRQYIASWVTNDQAVEIPRNHVANVLKSSGFF